MSKRYESRPEHHRPQVASPGLDQFLGGALERPATRTEIRCSLYAAFNPAPERPDEESAPHRIMVMWRLVRVTAQAKGLCADEETLDGSTDVQPNPWTNPFRPVMAPSAQLALRKERAAKLLLLHAEGEGLPLLPPRDEPDSLERWCNAAALIASELGVERHPKGLLGLIPLVRPVLASQCDVTAGQVIAFEDLIMEEALDLLLDVGERATVKHYRDEYGLARKEALGLIRLAKAQARARTAGSVEEKRALQEARLENYLARCKDTMDMDGEMKALKELDKVQGLTRTDPENQAMEFLEIVRRESRVQDQELLDARAVELIESHGAEEVDAIVIDRPATDPDDRESLAEYDRENQHHG